MASVAVATLSWTAAAGPATASGTCAELAGTATMKDIVHVVASRAAARVRRHAADLFICPLAHARGRERVRATGTSVHRHTENHVSGLSVWLMTATRGIGRDECSKPPRSAPPAGGRRRPEHR